MRAIIVSKKSEHIGNNCKLCGHVVREGQSILVDLVTEIRFGSGRTRRYHTSCMRDLCNGARPGIDEADQLVELIVATGNPFATIA